MTFVSFFAGIGGGDLGFEAAGHVCLAQIENDPICRQVLRAHWSATAILGDIHHVDAADLPKAGLHIVSDPCQMNTTANSRINSGRTQPSLWREAYRIISETRPAFVVRENPTHQRKDAPSRHEYVAAQLENSGYVCTIIDMQGGEVSGVSRQRTFVCAGLGPAGERLHQLLARHRCAKRDWPSHGSAAQPFAALTCHPYRYDNRDNIVAYPDGRCRVLGVRERLRAQGLPQTWLDCLGGVGLFRAAKLTGNAWPPFMAEFIGRLLMDGQHGGMQ